MGVIARQAALQGGLAGAGSAAGLWAVSVMPTVATSV